MIRFHGKYRVDREVEEPIRRTFLKGIGAVVVLLFLIAVAGALSHAKTGDPLAMLIDVIALLALLATIQTYSRAVAAKRLEAARSLHKAKRFDQVAAVLEGYIGRRSRFDPTGEAHYLLAFAAKQLGEDEVVTYCKAFLTKFRRGEWSKKAAKLRP